MKQIPFRIVNLLVDSFKLYENKLLQEIPVEVRTSYGFGVNTENHVVKARLTYQYLQGDTVLLEMTPTKIRIGKFYSSANKSCRSTS